MPKGGGAVRGIGEKITITPARGTCSLQVPIATTAGRGGFGPSLVLSYDSGTGNSPYGMGWSVPVPAIGRKTDKGVPRYTDEDMFVVAGGEDLVPAADPVPDETIDGVIYRITRFRPRVEAAFTRIERCRRADGSDTFWRAVDAANVTSLFGRSAMARIADPADPRRVFQWLLEEVRDDRGNVSTYEYRPESPSGVDPSTPWDQHRLGLDQAQRYLHRIRYCEHFVVEFEYADAVRLDAFSTYRSGFEVRTWRLCTRILTLHDFPAEFADGGPNPRLVHSTDLSHDGDPAGVHLTAIRHTGFGWAGGYHPQSMPPLELAYTRSQADTIVRTADAGSVENLPAAVDSQHYHWVDLNGEGIPGALTEQGGAWFFKPNLGGGRLGAQRRLPSQPALAGDGGSIALMDLAGDGARALVRHGPGLRGYQEQLASGDWGPFVAFRSSPTISFDDPDLRAADLTGDGLTDVLLAYGPELVWHPSLGRDGYDEQRRTLVGTDENRGPVLLRTEPTESVLLADMSGDGLADLVRIRNGSVCYWPNLGHGRFGAKVVMGGAPMFDHPDQFTPGQLRVADIDGSGTTDLLYVAATGEVRYWLNQSGNSFTAPRQLAAVPDTDRLDQVEVVDLLGTGTACLAWSSSSPAKRNAPLRYVDLSRAVSDWLPPGDAGWAGHKAHLLCQVTNNMGAQTRLVYAPSTRYYLTDQEAGRPWLTRLPFPVHLVSRVETYDHVAKTRLVSSYRYRHGHHDAMEREFRGFAMVEQTDLESLPLFDQGSATQLHRPPVRTRSWYHLGSPLTGFADEYFGADPPLPDNELPTGLTAREWREALRALAGRPLRSEVYADDGSVQAAYPYSVTEHRYRVARVQPASGDGHAVFRHYPLETLTHQYEREPTDPRVSHEIALEVDEYNTVLRKLMLGYPRRTAQITEQERLAAVLTTSEVRHATTGTYRLRVPIESRSYEVSGLPVPGVPFSVGAAVAALAGPVQLRQLKGLQYRYWNDALTAALPAGQVGTRALVHQRFTLALTADVVTEVYGSRVDTTMLADECRYVSLDGAWWIPSGVQHHDPAAFYLPVRLVSPWGNESIVEYDPHRLLPVLSRASQVAPLDQLVTQVAYDYRVLAPREITDPNGTRTRVAFDPLGRVIAAWVTGKDGEGDPDGQPGVEYEYGDSSWYDTGTPVWSLTRLRERHGDPTGPWQRSKAYSDGSGRVVLSKTQAEPGLAWALVNGVATQVDTTPALRWVGNGRTVFDNKGRPVKQYEPYFSPNDSYEDAPELVQHGVTPILYYDPIGRLIRTDRPDGTLSRVVYGSWRQEGWDPNDTVLDSLWYAERGSPDPANPAGESDPDPQRRAAWLAAQHANTPGVSYLDTLGRVVRTLTDAGPLGVFETRNVLDIEGNTLTVTDPRGVTVLDQRLDLIGRVLHAHTADAGHRFALPDIAGVPVRSWDSAEGVPGHAVRFEFDLLRRPVRTWVISPQGTVRLVEATWFGESHPMALPNNLLGRAATVLDGAGLAQSIRYDFKGNPLVGRRRLATTYDHTPDWTTLANVAITDVETEANLAGLLETEIYPVRNEFDALNRPVSNVLPDGSILATTYNEAGLMETVAVNHIGSIGSQPYVRQLDYDAKGQRQLIVYGNDVRTRYSYDPLTYRLTRLETFRAGAVDQRLQDLRYTYDPVGNVTEIRDDAQQTLFYAGQVATPSTRYAYDALYRLAGAAGREHDSLGAQPDQNEPTFGKPVPHPNDATKIRPYREEYGYDEAGNITRLRHIAAGASWTREYTYAGDSNHLLGHSQPGSPVQLAFGYDERGNMRTMPHLPGNLDWDHANRLSSVDLQGGGMSHYRYDAAGARQRRVLARLGAVVEDRIYLGGYEVHRRRVNGSEVFRRTTVHVMDDIRRIALIEHKTIDNGPANELRVRYQIGNHLGSCSLELDDSTQAQIISYEEYHPYGTTSLWLGANQVEVSDRRYRYTGKEKDAETALYFHNARYYAPWLARWTSPDPAGLVDGTNLFAYVRNNPVRLSDPSGRWSAEQEAKLRAERRLAGSLGPDEIADVYKAAPENLEPPNTEQFHEAERRALEKGRAKRAAAKAAAAKNKPLNREQRFQVAKDSARNWLIDKASVEPTTAALMPVLIPNALLTHYVLKPLRAPEPPKHPHTFAEWQAREEYDFAQGTMTTIELGATLAVGPVLETAGTLRAGVEAGTAGATTVAETTAAAETSTAAPAAANPFGFMADLEATGQKLQQQVDAAKAAVQPWQGFPMSKGGVPYQLQVSGATTMVEGQPITAITFSHPNAHALYAEGHLTLPEGTALGKAPPLGKLAPEAHVERAAVESVDPERVRGGLVTTSGGACVDCSQAWYEGDFSTWIHLKWQDFGF